MQLFDGVGFGDDENLVTTFERRAAEVVGVQVLELQIRSGRAVINQDMFAQCTEVGVVRARSGEGRTRAGLH